MNLHVSAALAVAVLWGLSGSLRGATLFSNLGLATSSSVVLSSSLGELATDFMTGTDATLVTGATFRLLNQDDIPHTLTVGIYGDNSGTPGSLVGTFGTTISLSASDPAFALHSVSTSGIPLAAGTAYWVVLALNENLSFNYVRWSQTGLATTDPGSIYTTISGTQIQTSSDGGANFTNAAAGNAHFALTGSVPEPAATFLAGAGLGCLLLLRRVRS